MDVDMDDGDEDVQLVREPAAGKSFPSYTGLLKPSPTVKRQTKGTPIDIPTTQRRTSNFSVHTANTAQVTGSRDNPYQRKTTLAQQRSQHAASLSARHGVKDTAEIHGTVHSAGSAGSGKKQKTAEVVLLSDEDDMKDPKTVKRKKHTQDGDSHIGKHHTSESRPSSIVSKMKKDTTPAGPEASFNYNDVDPAPKHRRTFSRNEASFAANKLDIDFLQACLIVDDKADINNPNEVNVVVNKADLALIQISYVFSNAHNIFCKPRFSAYEVCIDIPPYNLASVVPNPREDPRLWFPLSLRHVRVGTKVDFKLPKMAVQLGPDRFIINIDKIATKIPHSKLKTVGYFVEGETKLIILSTREKLDPESPMATYYDPDPLSGKAKRIVLYTTSPGTDIQEYCNKLAVLGYATKELKEDSAEKYFQDTSAYSPADSPKSSNAVVPNIPSNPANIQPRQTLFMFPFKNNPKSKSIAVHIEDLGRLFDGDFLNDILIEFGLKYVYDGLEKRNPGLADKTFMFNTFFFERLTSRPALHWYLAIITNPGLLLGDDQEHAKAPSPEPVPASRQSSSPQLDSRSGSSPGSPVLPSVAESIESLAGSTEGQLRIKGEHAADKGDWAPRRSSRSSSAVPIDVEAKPYILILDSLGSNHPHAFKALRLYLQQELLTRKGIDRTLGITDVVGKYAKPPQQKNFSDCGLFLLHYAEVFLKTPGPLLDVIVNNKPEQEQAEYWVAEELPEKRQYYSDVVVELSEAYKVFTAEQQESSAQSRNTIRVITESLKAPTDKTGK
ncbi:hypothetical protein BGX23_000594 [Mortierella sp. AD031]|nr:hypothetical protein BGX23_000594 [Mortierella sp. AD031]